MMNRRLGLIMCCALLLCAFSGCRLALEYDDAAMHEDRLIGLFVTTQHLDLFDFERYMMDNMNDFRGGEMAVGADAQKYQGRLYATLMTQVLTSEETGKTTEIEEYVFDTVEGIPYFAPTVPAVDGRDSYLSSSSDDAISDGALHVNYSDEGVGITLDGTIYITPRYASHVFYFNPVYQSANGSVYLTAGDGTAGNAESFQEGAVFSQTHDAVTTITENGTVTTHSTSITVSVCVLSAPDKIVVLQMNADNAPIAETEYAPHAMPETLAPDSKAAYLIVESHKRDAAGNPTISRAIYERGVENVETFYARADGICLKQSTPIVWE